MYIVCACVGMPGNEAKWGKTGGLWSAINY